MADIKKPISITDKVLKEGSGNVNKLVSLKQIGNESLLSCCFPCFWLSPGGSFVSGLKLNPCLSEGTDWTCPALHTCGKPESSAIPSARFFWSALSVYGDLFDAFLLSQTALQWLLTGTGPLTSPGCENGAFFKTTPDKGSSDVQVKCNM